MQFAAHEQFQVFIFFFILIGIPFSLFFSLLNLQFEFKLLWQICNQIFFEYMI
jgi:hypothetical protein